MSEQDTRERLEADALDYVVKMAKLCHGMGLRHELWQFNPEPLHMHIRQCLDRQAAITKAEGDYYCDRCRIDVKRRIAELTAEVEKQRQRANDAERGALSDEWYVARDRYEDDVAALTAERDELLAAIDAMNNGQFYSMYKAKCEECEQLKKVVRTQADSFKSLEIELSKARGNQ